jgi:phosphate transport system ATP-binding protein
VVTAGPPHSKIVTEKLTVAYGSEPPALLDVSLAIPENSISVLFGPAGGGKSTLLRTLDRLNDLVDDAHVSGSVLLDGEDILGPSVDVVRLRRRVSTSCA